MNITTYLGANEGNDPTLYKAVTELGAWIGQLCYFGYVSGEYWNGDIYCYWCAM